MKSFSPKISFRSKEKINSPQSVNRELGEIKGLHGTNLLNSYSLSQIKTKLTYFL